MVTRIRIHLRRAILLGAALPLMAGCMAHDYFSSAPGGAVTSLSLNDVLSIEYENVAAFQDSQLHDSAHAAYFREKAALAKAGQTPPPEDPSAYPSLSLSKIGQLDEARFNLTQAQAMFNTPENAALLAMAQTRFDCWLMTIAFVRGAENTQPACQTMYQDAMRVLEIPGLDLERVYAVTFKPNLAEISPEGRVLLKEVARVFPRTGQFTVVLKAYSETRGSRDAAEVVTMRRSLSVRNALAQLGVGMEDIRFEAGGRQNPGRVDIQILTLSRAKQRKAADLETMFPNHFGKHAETF